LFIALSKSKSQEQCVRLCEGLIVLNLTPPKKWQLDTRALRHAHRFLLSHTQRFAFSMLCVIQGRLPSVRHYF